MINYLNNIIYLHRTYVSTYVSKVFTTYVCKYLCKYVFFKKGIFWKKEDFNLCKRLT